MQGGPAHLHHRSLYQPREPAFWVFAVFVLYGAFQVISVLSGLSAVSRSAWALSWLLLTLYALPIVVLVVRLDLYEREPVSLMIGSFAWGAFAATALTLDAAGWDQVVAQVLGADAATLWGPAITAPLVEETLKGAGIVLLYLIARDEFDDVMDGFVYGALCGLGFAIVEDVLYFMAAFGGTAAGVLEGFYVRVLSSGLYGHVLYTGLVGMGIGYTVSRRSTVPLGRRIAVLTGLVALAVAAHALWNSPLLDFLPDEPIEGVEWIQVPFALAVKGLPLLLLVALALVLARNRERRWLDSALESEVGEGGLTAEELEILRTPKRRRAEVREMRARGGAPAAQLLGRLQREQIDLAMLASRVATREDPALIAQRAYCRSLRDALLAIPGAARAQAG